MAHHYSNSLYDRLADRLNQFPQGAPLSDSLFAILKILFSEKEAGLVAQLPIKPFTVDRAAAIWKLDKATAQNMLEDLAGRAMLLDMEQNGQQMFCLPPPMAGFIEFALMRTRGDIDQKYLSELYYQYMNVEEDFIKDLFYATETKLGRVFVQEPVLTNDKMNHILDYERATHIVEEAEYIGLGLCYCRHKMSHAGHPCEINAPWDVCLTFDNVARSLAQHGDYCRLISREEALDALERSYASNLVQIGENVREHPAFICNCCGCCCEALQAARHFSPMQPVATTNYIPDITGDQCVGCGKCAKACPVLAISMEEGENGRKRAVVDKDICLGCGVCARNCGVKAIHMERRPEQIITPVNSTHRFVLQAIEKGTLANLVFDNQAFSNHRAMAALFSAILELPPLKQAMASKQFKSVYLDRLLAAKREKG
jgi:Pyruvate/2-oxoacid:ferredoxin oxidoreductase delta subunit